MKFEQGSSGPLVGGRVAHRGGEVPEVSWPRSEQCH